MSNKKNINDLSVLENLQNEGSHQSSPHRNPNEYNGETIDNQLVIPNNPSNRKVYIEGYVCL